MFHLKGRGRLGRCWWTVAIGLSGGFLKSRGQPYEAGTGIGDEDGIVIRELFQRFQDFKSWCLIHGHALHTNGCPSYATRSARL